MRKKMKRVRRVFLSAVLLSLMTGFAGAQSITGLKVMENVYNRPTGPDITSELTMTLTNSRGSTRVRTIRQFIKEYGADEKKIMFFTAPADVKNTSFMDWSYGDSSKEDDMWIYLPALKKVKRISSENKSDYFMGSDFTYDDLGDRKPEQDTHKIIGEETIKGKDCYVIESTPKDPDYMYSKTVTWVVKDSWVGAKKEFYDEDGELLKTLTIHTIKKIDGYWVILDMEMENVQKDHKTRMELRNVKIGSGIKDSYFTDRMMKKGVR